MLLDSSSGLSYNAINAVVSADLVLVVNTEDEAQAEGTQLMVQNLYNLFEKKTALIVNKASLTKKRNNEIDSLKILVNEQYNLPVVGIIPCFCELNNKNIISLYLDNPNHPYSKIIKQITKRLDSLKIGEQAYKNNKMLEIYRQEFIKKTTGIVI